MNRPRVLLADDHTLLLDAFEKLLEPECNIIGKVADGRALLKAARELRPDIIVIDISMPKLNGMDAAIQLRKTVPKSRLIFLTMNEDPDLAAQAMEIGASGYLLKTSAAAELLQAVREARKGRSFVSPLATHGMVASLMRKRHKKDARALTPRQREVLQLLAEGYSMKQVAATLEVKTRTVAFHKYTMMEKLGIKTSARLVQYAVKHGLVTP